ncbi:MAG: thioredoxin-dependent thiol peroxidase [Rhodospirillales bacterium]|nr:thioredoxin-dependent thiol peroxidase [Rhodospirillales bacterium]
MVDIGDTAPDFSAPTDGGGTFSLKAQRGAAVVLFFYPKDMTPGCTKEAIAFSEQIKDFEAADAIVVGISKDTVARHDKFRDKYDLKVTLVSDEDISICEKYGVWVEKSLYGRKYMGIERTTFLIDAKGKVRMVWHKVKVPGHSDAVLSDVKAL